MIYVSKIYFLIKEIEGKSRDPHALGDGAFLIKSSSLLTASLLKYLASLLRTHFNPRASEGPLLTLFQRDLFTDYEHLVACLRTSWIQCRIKQKTTTLSNMRQAGFHHITLL